MARNAIESDLRSSKMAAGDRCHIKFFLPNKLPPGNYTCTIWQKFPIKEYNMANLPPEEIPWQNFPRGETIPYGKATPSMVNLPPTQISWWGNKYHGRFPPPEIIPYGKRSLWRNTIWQTFPRKKSHSRTSPGLRGGILPYGNPPPPPGRNPTAELPQGGNNTIWQTFPLYGKSPLTQIPYVILEQHGGELLRYGILSGGKEIHGRKKNPMWPAAILWKISKKIKVAYWSEMERNAIESDFRSYKMAAGSHFVKKNSNKIKVAYWSEIVRNAKRKWFSVILRARYTPGDCW